MSVIEIKVCIENLGVIRPCGKTAANPLVHRGAINAVTRDDYFKTLALCSA